MLSITVVYSMLLLFFCLLLSCQYPIIACFGERGWRFIKTYCPGILCTSDCLQFVKKVDSSNNLDYNILILTEFCPSLHGLGTSQKPPVSFDPMPKALNNRVMIHLRLSNRSSRVGFVFGLKLNGLKTPHLNRTCLISGFKNLTWTRLIFKRVDLILTRLT